MADSTSPQSSPTQSRLVLVSTLLVGIVATFIVLYAITNRPRSAGTPVVDLSQNLNGIEAVTPPRQVQDFTLINQESKSVSLSDFRSKLVLMFFGFTNCEDICPITLMQFKLIRQQLGADAEKVAFVFVSVDPKRDTADVIATYLKRFDSSITGLVGDMKVFDTIRSDYNLEFVEVPREGSTSATDYGVSHTPNPYLLDTTGKLVARYAYGMDIKMMVSDIKSRLAS